MPPFSYTPFDSSRYVQSIGEILAHQNDAQARAAENIGAASARARAASGDIWGRAIAQAGQIPGQMIAQQRDQQDRAQERQLRGLQIDNATDVRTERQASRAQDQLFSKLLGSGQPPSPQQIMQIYGPERGAKIADAISAFGELQSKEGADKRANVARIAIGAKALGTDMQAALWPQLQQATIGAGLIPENQFPTEPNLAFLDGIIALSTGKAVEPPKLTEHDPAKSLVGPAGNVVIPAVAQPLKRTDTEAALDAFAKSIGKERAEDLSYADRRQFEKDKATTVSDQAYLQHQRARNYDIAHPIPSEGKSQDQLEQDTRQLLARGLSSRSGGLGLEDSKVQQANHLTALIDASYDPKTGNYNIPKVMQSELALGLARLVSPGGTVGVQLMRDLNQATAKGDLNAALTYITGAPFNGSTQDIVAMFKDSIERQGEVALQNREGEMAYLRNLMPTSLEEPRRKKLESVGLNPLRKSRIIQNASTGERKIQVSTDGGKTWK